MLQNGLYWSFYCSSVRNFVQVVIYDVIINLHIFYKCQGETSRTSLKWTNHQQPVSTTITPERPQLLVPLRKKKKKIQTTKKKKSSRQFFFFSSIVNHSASGSKTKSQIRICVGGKQTKDFGSETMFRCLYMSKVRFHHHVNRYSSVHFPALPFFSSIFTTKEAF